MVEKRNKKNLPLAVSSCIWGYLTTLEKQGISIKNAYLFGSWAKGTEHKDSDIDLAIISPAFRTWETKTNKLSRAMRMDFSMIESHGFHPKQFDPRTNPVAYEIKKYGIKII